MRYALCVTVFQQTLALIIIFFFASRLFWQKKNKQINPNEFIFWLIFWLFAGIAIIFLKKIDYLVASLGFSGKGIDILFYFFLIILFYFILRLRLRIAKMEKNITKIVRKIALKDKNIS